MMNSFTALTNLGSFCNSFKVSQMSSLPFIKPLGMASYLSLSFTFPHAIGPAWISQAGRPPSGRARWGSFLLPIYGNHSPVKLNIFIWHIRMDKYLLAGIARVGRRLDTVNIKRGACRGMVETVSIRTLLEITINSKGDASLN